MRILSIQPFLHSGIFDVRTGSGSRAANVLLREFLRAGHDAAVLPVGEKFLGRYDWGVAADYQIQVWPPLQIPYLSEMRDLPSVFPVVRRRGGNWITYLTVTAIGRAVRAFRPDILHCHIPGLRLPEILRALRIDTPLIFSAHGFTPEEDWAAYAGWGVRSAVLGDRISQEGGLTWEKILVIPDPLEDDWLTGDVPADSERSGVIYISNTLSAEGAEKVLAAYRALPQAREQPLSILCADADAAWIRAIAESRRQAVHLEPILPIEKMTSRMAHAKVLIDPAGDWTREAMVSGTPVVGRIIDVEEMESLIDLPAGVEWLEDQGGSGLGDGIAVALSSAICSTESRRAMAAAARDLLRSKKSAERYLALFHEAIANKKAM